MPHPASQSMKASASMQPQHTRPSTIPSFSAARKRVPSAAAQPALPPHLAAPGMQVSPSAPADTQTATFQQVVGTDGRSSSATGQNQEYIPYAMPHMQQKANMAAAAAAVAAAAANVPAQAPMSAPPTVTAFSPALTGACSADTSRKYPSVSVAVGVDDGNTASPAKKPRQRRESAQATLSAVSKSGSSSRQRAATSSGAPAPDTAALVADAQQAAAGHKRKPSQNTLWQNSRAILTNAVAGSAAGGPASPAKPSVLAAAPPAATPSPSRRQSAPVQNAAYTVTGHGQVQTPQRSVAALGQAIYPSQGGVPQSAPAHYANYAPFTSSNLNPSPVHPSLLQHGQAILSPAGPGHFVQPAYAQYTLATPQQPLYIQQPHTVGGVQYIQATPLQEAQMHAQAAHYLQMTAPQPSGTYTLHNPQQQQPRYAFSPPLLAAQAHVQADSPASNAGSFVAPLAPQQRPDGPASRGRSQSGLSRTPSDLSTIGASAPGVEHPSASQQGGPSSSQDSSLDTTLSLSQPVPQAAGRTRTTTAPAQLGLSANSEQESSSAAELMLFLAHSPSPKAASRKTVPAGIGADLKGRRLFAGSSQEGLSSHVAGPETSTMGQTFSAQQFLQAAPEGTYTAGNDHFNGHSHLQQPFEYGQFGMVGAGQPVELGQDFGNPW